MIKIHQLKIKIEWNLKIEFISGQILMLYET